MGTEGQRIAERRIALKMNKSELAREADVNRDTIADIEAGKGWQAATLAKLNDALTRLEGESGMFAPPPASEPEVMPSGLVRYKVQGVYGVDALVVEGPVENIAELEASVDRILRRIQGERPAVVSEDPETDAAK